jgi:ribulose bisphosphate carboxylase small subunit
MTNAITQEMLADYAAFIKQDYIDWWKGGPFGTKALTEIQQNMVDEFLIEFEEGSSYIRVVQSTPTGQRSSHSFIVKKAGQFPVGTILKSASWKAPAKNFARGSIVTGDFKRVRWTGVL